MSLESSIDQMGREVTFSFPPNRIVSLVPSQTEYLLSLNAPVVGRTKFCIHPEYKVKGILKIGGTKKVRLDAIDKLKPDIIIGNKEENTEEDISELAKRFPIWMSDIYTLEDAFEMMESLGQICDRQTEARNAITECRAAMDAVKGTRSGRVVYLIWRDPWMATGKHTFINHLLHHLGYQNVIEEDRYPEITTEQIKALDPDKILFSSEPYPFKEKHLEEAKSLWPKATCKLVDGEKYSWYGNRLSTWL